MASAYRQRGFTYLLVLFFIATVAAGLAAVGELWSTSRQQERERELLFAGNAIRQAIGAYYLGTEGPVKRYPASLEDLLKDPRYIYTQRYLRRLYPDPLGSGGKWGLINAPQGGIMGVHSLSESKPIKNAGFRPLDADFERAAMYSDWKFVFVPAQGGANAQAKPASRSR